ncbi:MAG: bifunctional tetrahydrofolate synthase/dihydrofolate synthase [Pseudomonadota bacterium]
MSQLKNNLGAPPFDSLNEWLQWQESAAPVEIDLGLDRCRGVAESLNINCGDAVVVTVAGTNGKGSSVTMLEQIWISAGYKVAAYTSPHMIAYNERIRLNGIPVSSKKICEAFAKIESSRQEIHLTYFEYSTLAALEIFQSNQPDVVLLEVGLGGRLDAVNIIDADVALITSIGIDHVEFLGNDRESIGGEKAGIMRGGRPAVCSDPEVPMSVVNHASEVGAELDLLGVDFRITERAGDWDWWNQKTSYLNLPRPKLEGDYQFRNAAGVLQVVEHLQAKLPVSRTVIENMLQSVTLWGRFQTFPGPIEYIFDVAHNVQAVEQFVETLEKHGTGGNTHLVLGMLKTKDRATVMEVLRPAVDRWYLASLDARRGTSNTELYESLQELPGAIESQLFDSVSEALNAASERATEGDKIIALGSFLVVSEALRYLNKADRYTIEEQ